MNQTPKSSGLVIGLQSLQWMVFLLANIIAVPIAIGAAFDMSVAETSAFVQRMLLITGVATLLQAFFGHRLPLLEGAAGMWWSLFMLLAAMAVPGSKGLVLQQLEAGLIVAGIALVIIACLPIMGKIRQLFTPLVTGVNFLLLVMQLSGSFFKGMLGVTRTSHVDLRIAGVSLLTIVLVLLVSLKGRGMLRSMGPLVGIVVGWIVFKLVGLGGGHESSLAAASSGWFAVPHLFAWGQPVWSFGILLTSILTGIILISNVVASIVVIGKALDVEIDTNTFRKGLLLNGINSMLSGGTAVVGMVPLSVSAGFITTTGIRARSPFVIGAVLVTLSGFLPVIGQFFASMPSEVAYASLFVPFANMVGFGIRDLMSVEPSQRNMLVIGLSIFVGAGVMFLPPEALESLAPWIRNLIANGLLTGLILCLVLDNLVFRKGKESNKATV